MSDCVDVFVCSRWIDGAWYGVNIPARSVAEAQEICQRNSWRFDGKLMMTIGGPGAGIKARLLCWLMNVVKRPNQ